MHADALLVGHLVTGWLPWGGGCPEPFTPGLCERVGGLVVTLLSVGLSQLHLSVLPRFTVCQHPQVGQLRGTLRIESGACAGRWTPHGMCPVEPSACGWCTAWRRFAVAVLSLVRPKAGQGHSPLILLVRRLRWSSGSYRSHRAVRPDVSEGGGFAVSPSAPQIGAGWRCRPGSPGEGWDSPAVPSQRGCQGAAWTGRDALDGGKMPPAQSA